MTQVSSGTQDLNNYKLPGHHWYYFTADTTLTNQPNNAVNGWLETISSNPKESLTASFKQYWHRLGSIAGNTFKDLYFRTYDSNEGWSNWEKVLVTAPTILYDNDLNTFDTAIITLNDDALNYAYLKIFFKDNDNIRGSIDVIPTANRSFPLMIFHTSANRDLAYVKLKVMTIDSSNTYQIRTGQKGDGTYSYNAELVWSNNSIIGGNYIAITKVIGYKNF